MKKSVSGNELKSWIQNYTHNKDLPVYTNWGVVMLDELIPFLTAARLRGSNAVAIALVRFELKEDGESSSGTGRPRIKAAGMGLSQVSFAFITGDTQVKEPWPMVARKDGDSYSVFCICEPGHMLIEDPSGLCPPQGDEIIIDGP